jgi:hypothetical protein
MACGTEREEKNCQMDSVFVAMGGRGIPQNHPAGMIVTRDVDIKLKSLTFYNNRSFYLEL